MAQKEMGEGGNPMTDQPDLDFTPRQKEFMEDEKSNDRLKSYIGGTAPQAHARRTDPRTSHAVARRITNTQKVRAHIEYLFRNLGRMHDESLIVNYLASSSNLRPHATEQSIRSRRKELVDRNVLRDSGEKKLTRAGNPSAVWEIVKS